MAQMKKNLKVVFANQKGGVGKTTLCMMFANYLAQKGKPCCVIDTDLQKTIYTQRQDDLRDYDDDLEIPYQVQAFSLENPQNVRNLMESISSTPGYFLFDAPGSLTQDGLIQLFAHADYIITPYQYEKKTINSTGIFIEVISQLKEKIEDMAGDIFFVPNKFDSRVGTVRELQSYMATDDLFKKFGQVTPRVNNRISLTRIDTISNDSQQNKEVRDAFDYLIRNMK